VSRATLPAPPPADVVLGRPEFAGDLGQAAAFMRGRRVLLTGAAGSVGWPLALACAEAEPASLVALDHHEYSLFSLERVLRSRASYELADVRDRARLERVFVGAQPEIVIHLAAAKHVPYGERFPEGAVAANVLATRDVLELAEAHGTRMLVYPSSDKSVQPPSVYGATKRLCEGLVQAAAASSQRQFVVVRFVNIIGTRGSVVETFTQQVLEDRPLSVTDERMTRYWISMHEALWCVLLAAQCAAPGEVVMPACGEAVPLLETARRLAGWYRPEQDPYPIVCTGIRPGERLHEVLLSSNEHVLGGDGPAPGVLGVRSRRDPAALACLPDVVAELERLVAAADRERLVALCLKTAEALQ